MHTTTAVFLACCVRQSLIWMAQLYSYSVNSYSYTVRLKSGLRRGQLQVAAPEGYVHQRESGWKGVLRERSFSLTSHNGLFFFLPLYKSTKYRCHEANYWTCSDHPYFSTCPPQSAPLKIPPLPQISCSVCLRHMHAHGGEPTQASVRHKLGNCSTDSCYLAEPSLCSQHSG